MRKCPFCNADVKLDFPDLIYVEDLKQWTFLHSCNCNRSVFVSADSLDELIAEWNGDYEEQTSESL